MRKAIVFVLWVIFVGALHLFGNNVGTLVVLVASIAMPLCGVASLYMVGKPLVTVFPNGHIALHKPWLGRVYTVVCTITCHNRLTGERDHNRVPMTPHSIFQVEATHCGALDIVVSELSIADPFGLFQRRFKYDVGCYMIMPPKGHPMPVPDVPPSLNPESDLYSTLKAGMDVSETFGIREYQPGDPIRSIHWKLSEKLDKTMVRELGLPISHRVCMTLDMSTQGVSPKGRHDTMEMFYSLCLAFVGSGAPITIKWAVDAGQWIQREAIHPGDVDIAIKECLGTMAPVGTAHKLSHTQDGHMVTVTAGEVPVVGGALC